MKLQFWGVRGSIPSPMGSKDIFKKIKEILARSQWINFTKKIDINDFIKNLSPEISQVIGGNTSCLEISTNDTLIILDAGSGLRLLGKELMKRKDFQNGTGTGHLLLSHTHWDHIQGLPFFNPFYTEGNIFNIYGHNPNLKEILHSQQKSPTMFPLAFEQMPATINFNEIIKNEIIINNIKIKTINLHHPGKSLGFRIESQGKAIVYTTDLEFTALSPQTITPFINFIKEADILIYDSQYTFMGSIAREGWGHSTSLIGVDLALRANVKTLYLFHHDPDHDDFTLYEILEKTKAYYNLVKKEKEEMKINLATEESIINI